MKHREKKPCAKCQAPIPPHATGGHVVLGGSHELRCLHCGESESIPTNTTINVWKAYADDFGKAHRSCAPSVKAIHRFQWRKNDPHDWERSWVTGVSSLTLFAAVTGTTRTPYGYPHDPADFKRCIDFVRSMDAWSWETMLEPVVTRCKHWEFFIPVWDELVALYDEEYPTGTAPKLYDRLRALGKEAEAKHGFL